MVELSPLEIKALCSIAGINNLFGLPFNIQLNESKGDMDTLLTGLKGKDLIKGEKLTDKGKVLIALMEYYEKSDKHLFLNRTRIAMDKDSVTVFVKQEETVCIYRKHKLEFLEDLVMNNDFLRQAQKKTYIRKEPVPYVGDWIEVESKKYPHYLIAKKYNKKKETKYGYLCWDDEQAVYYDCYKKNILKLGPRETRIFLMDLLEIPKEDL